MIIRSDPDLGKGWERGAADGLTWDYVNCNEMARDDGGD